MAAPALGTQHKPVADSMISVNIRHMAYGETEILRAVRFELFRGESLAILGASGIGKTTLLRVIAGLIKSFDGEITGIGNLAIVFQEPTLLPWRSALDNLILTTGITPEAAHSALTEVGLADKAGHFPGQLSLGQQRRLALARAFAAEPDLLLLDEPFASLDETTATAMIALTARMLSNRTVSCLLVTHAAEEAVALADRALLMAGRPGTIVGEYRIDDQSNGPAGNAANDLRAAVAKIAS